MSCQTTAALLAISAAISSCAREDDRAGPRNDEPLTNVDVQPAVDTTNGLGLDLFRLLGKKPQRQNLFLSPYSIAVALAMAAEGARDETAREMAQVLHLAADPGSRPITAVHAAFASLARRFRAGGGTAGSLAREQIERLQTRLAAANRQAAALQQQQQWEAAQVQDRAAQQIAAELNALLQTVDRYDLRVANALWVEQTYSLAPDYVQTIERFHGTGGVTPLDILGDAEQARLRINGWVEDHTNRRIKELIPFLAPETRFVISNAVYFRGEWATPFDVGATREQDFTLASGERIRRRMMRDPNREAVAYAAFRGDGSYFATPTEVPRDEARRPPTYPDDAGFTIIELPYKGAELAMVVVVPRAADGLARVEAMLTTAALASWLRHLEPRTVDTTMLRFELAADCVLQDTLQALGMRRAFANPTEPGGAQFGGMCASADHAQQLSIGGVFHKAWIEVNEQGTEAAAATSILMATGAAAPPELVPFQPEFRADRPFLFLIRDTKSGAILFLGRMLDPRT